MLHMYVARRVMPRGGRCWNSQLAQVLPANPRQRPQFTQIQATIGALCPALLPATCKQLVYRPSCWPPLCKHRGQYRPGLARRAALRSTHPAPRPKPPQRRPSHSQPCHRRRVQRRCPSPTTHCPLPAWRCPRAPPSWPPTCASWASWCRRSCRCWAPRRRGPPGGVPPRCCRSLTPRGCRWAGAGGWVGGMVWLIDGHGCKPACWALNPCSAVVLLCSTTACLPTHPIRPTTSGCGGGHGAVRGRVPLSGVWHRAGTPAEAVACAGRLAVQRGMHARMCFLLASTAHPNRTFRPMLLPPLCRLRWRSASCSASCPARRSCRMCSGARWARSSGEAAWWCGRRVLVAHQPCCR